MSPGNDDFFRAFIAIPLPDEVRDALKTYMLPVKKALERKKTVRWVPSGNYHVTLAFLGSIPVARQAALGEVMVDVCREQAPFEVAIDSVAPFPSAKKARLFVAEVRPCDPLSRLQNRLVTGLHAAGFDGEDRRFRPHVTLARLKRPLSLPDKNRAGDRNRDDAFPLRLLVDRITLYQSETRQTGAIYSPLEEVLFPPRQG